MNGFVAALVTLLGLGAIPLDRCRPSIATTLASRVQILILVSIPSGHVVLLDTVSHVAHSRRRRIHTKMRPAAIGCRPSRRAFDDRTGTGRAAKETRSADSRYSAIRSLASLGGLSLTPGALPLRRMAIGKATREIADV